MKNKFLKNKIALVAVMIFLGSFSIALAAPSDGSRPPIHPGNSSQPVLNLKIGGSNLAQARLDVAGSNALSFFDKVDSFITVFGRLWIGGNTWLGLPSLFSVSSTDPLNPGLIALPIRTLNIAGTFLSSTLSHDGTIAIHRPVCVQDSKLILCTNNTPTLTYQWDIGAWGPCSTATAGYCSGVSTPSGSGSCVRNEFAYGACDWGNGPNGIPLVPEMSSATCSGQNTQSACSNVGYQGFFTHTGNCYRCAWDAPTTPSCSSYSSASSCTSNSCNWNAPGQSVQTRTVVCKDSNNTVVADSFCAQPKPSTTQPCSGGTTTTNSCQSAINGYASCFVENTKVQLANGEEKNIQEVKIGDVLRGGTSNNTVLGFHKPLLGSKKLYSFNNGPYFVTAEHPFKTTEGWKALDPELAVKEHKLNITVGQLELGDVLVTDKGLEKLVSLDSKSDSPNTQLYNFKLDGDHTYYADGYLVHNKAACMADGTCGQDTASVCIPSPQLGGGTCSLPCTNPGAIASAPGYCPTGYNYRYCDPDDFNWHCLNNPACVEDGSLGIGTGTIYSCSGGGWVDTGNTCNDPSVPISNDANMGPDGYDFFQGDTQCTTSQPGNCSCINASGPWVSPQPDRC